MISRMKNMPFSLWIRSAGGQGKPRAQTSRMWYGQATKANLSVFSCEFVLIDCANLSIFNLQHPPLPSFLVFYGVRLIDDWTRSPHLYSNLSKSINYMFHKILGY